MYDHMELIPGMPDDVARECLVRVDYKQLPAVVSVCKSWKSEVDRSEFRRLRKQAGSSKLLVVMAQARVDPEGSMGLLKYRPCPAYRLSVLEPGSGQWTELQPVEGADEGLLPMFCQVAGVGSDLVVLGGLDPLTWEVSRSVSVFSFVTSTWRRGADMPGPRRSLFGCAAGSGWVYVAGGHDEEKNALRSALMYDVAGDEWVILPDMASVRDECKAVFRCGKVHVIGGYRTESQGRFQRDAELFDVATQQWESPEGGFLEAATCPRTCSSADEDDLYICHGGDVVALKGTRWQVVSKLPTDVANIAYTTAWQGNLLLIGSAKFGDPHVAYVLDVENSRWTKVDTPAEFSGHVQSGCCLEV